MTNISVVPNMAEEAKNSRVKKITLTNDRKSLYILLQNGKTYLFTPSEADILAYYTAVATKSSDNYHEELDYDMPYVESMSFSERFHLCQMSKSCWEAIKLKQPTLVRRIENAIRKATRIRYVCLSVNKNCFTCGTAFVITGLVNGNYEAIKGSSLKECVNKTIDKINNDKVKALLTIQ